MQPRCSHVRKSLHHPLQRKLKAQSEGKFLQQVCSHGPQRSENHAHLRHRCRSATSPPFSKSPDVSDSNSNEFDIPSLDKVAEDAHSERMGACNGHSHSHGPRNRYLEKALRATGVLALAEALDEKVWVSVTICVLLGLATGLNWCQGLASFSVKSAQQLAIAGIYILAGLPEMVELMFNTLNGHLDTHVLMTLACLGTLAIGSAFEGALLLVLFNVSHTVEHVLSDKAQGSLNSLFDQIPQQAVVVELDASGAPKIAEARTVATSEVSVGSTVFVRPGQQVPLDGRIVFGDAFVSTEHLTGEALPVKKASGDEVLAGGLNHDGIIVVKTSSASADSTPARIAKLTEDAQKRRPQLYRWIDQAGEVYVRCVLAATALSFLVLRASGVPLMSSAAQRGALYRSIGLLTTASPCALVLVPLAYTAALAAITKRGMLMRGTHVLDALTQSSTIAFDKTGTLTTGHLSCSGIHTSGASSSNGAAPQSAPTITTVQEAMESGNAESQSAISSMVALSQRSNHPVSQAVASLAEELHLSSEDITDFKAVSGSGVQGQLLRKGRKRHVRFGSASYATEVLPHEDRARVIANAEDLASESVVSVLVDVQEGRQSSDGAAPPSSDADTVRLFTFTDEVHPASKAAVQRLQDGSWTKPQNSTAFAIAMLTGDSKAGAARIAKILGISTVKADLKPEEKLEQIEQVRRDAQARPGPSGVIMVGDGINDAPALAAADVGIAIASSPTEAASSVADVVFLRGDGIASLPFLLRAAKATQTVVKQNLVLALAAILALSLPVLSGRIPLWTAVALHEGSTLLVAINSLRLLSLKDDFSPAKQNRGAQSSAAGLRDLSLERAAAAA